MNSKSTIIGMKLATSLLDVDEILSEFHESVQKCQYSLRASENCHILGNLNKFEIFVIFEFSIIF